MLQAVILAAGLGSRIREFHALPKGFICLGDQPIIQESIQKLRACGIHDILIITGYSAESYNVFASTMQNVSTIFNPAYSIYGSLYSLYCAKNWVKNDFLILESDIIYEKKALEIIMKDSHSNAILLSGETQASDEVYVEASDKKLIRMSKQKEKLNLAQIYGEFVGINKLSFCDYQKLINDLDNNAALLHSGHYDEQGLVSLTRYADVFCLKSADLLWGEIDNLFQYERAKKLYYKINEKEYVS